MIILKEETYNIRKQAEIFNKKLFGSELTLDFDIKIKPSSSSFIGGWVSTSLGEVTELGLAKNKFPPEVLDAILVHELIHVWVIQNYGWEKASENKGHNDIFYKKRLEILSKFPDVEIPVKEDLESIDKILDKLGY